MYRVNDTVMVLENKKIMGLAYITDICKNQADVKKYFSILHPLYQKFTLAVSNNQEVYIVNFQNDNGQAGFIRQNLRSTGRKRKVWAQ